jgi:hypothetical protein
VAVQGAPLATDIRILREGTRHWLAQQSDDIGGTHLHRQDMRDELDKQLASHRLTLVKGLPGAGKTAFQADRGRDFSVIVDGVSD